VRGYDDVQVICFCFDFVVLQLVIWVSEIVMVSGLMVCLMGIGLFELPQLLLEI
jgi:hypothetical protein